MLSLMAAVGVEGTVNRPPPQLEGTGAGESIGIEASEKAVQFSDGGEATLGSECALSGFLFKQHDMRREEGECWQLHPSWSSFKGLKAKHLYCKTLYSLFIKCTSATCIPTRAPKFSRVHVPCGGQCTKGRGGSPFTWDS